MRARIERAGELARDRRGSLLATSRAEIEKLSRLAEKVLERFGRGSGVACG